MLHRVAMHVVFLSLLTPGLALAQAVRHHARSHARPCDHRRYLHLGSHFEARAISGAVRAHARSPGPGIGIRDHDSRPGQHGLGSFERTQSQYTLLLPARYERRRRSRGIVSHAAVFGELSRRRHESARAFQFSVSIWIMRGSKVGWRHGTGSSGLWHDAQTAAWSGSLLHYEWRLVVRGQTRVHG